MVLKNKFFCTLVSSLFLNFGIPLKINASPQIPNAVAENICWYVSKGLPVGLATTYALDPKMLLIDEKGVTPMYVAKNVKMNTRLIAEALNMFVQNLEG